MDPIGPIDPMDLTDPRGPNARVPEALIRLHLMGGARSQVTVAPPAWTYNPLFSKNNTSAQTSSLSQGIQAMHIRCSTQTFSAI